jgi:hypothetical protein
MSYSNPIQDHNDRVAHSDDCNEPPENYYLKDLIHSFFAGPKTLQLRLELQEVLRKFKELAQKYGEEEEISDSYLRDGLEALCTESVMSVWSDILLIERGDSE